MSTSAAGRTATAAGHLGYEVFQMACAAGLIDHPSGTTTGDLMSQATQGAAHNAALESTLLHARALIEFLLDARKHPDDIQRDDFRPAWPGPPDDVRQRLDTERKLLHKHLVHLSWERVGAEPAEWDYRATVREIVRQLGDFIDYVTDGIESGGVTKEVVQALRAHLQWARVQIAAWSAPAPDPTGGHRLGGVDHHVRLPQLTGARCRASADGTATTA